MSFLDDLTQPEIVERAKRLLLEGRDQEFLEFTEAAVEQLPNDPELRLLYATALLSYRPDEVAWEAATAIKLDPDNPWRLVRAASILFNRGEVDAARSYVARASQLVPEDFEFGPELANLGGLIAAKDGQDAMAEEGLRAALEAEPDRPDFARDLAMFLADRDRMPEARTIINEALRLTPRDRDLNQLRYRLAGD